MTIIEDSNENQMILEFLKAEINSQNPERSCVKEAIQNELEVLGLNENIITNGCITDGKNNERSKVLGAGRGYKKNLWLFKNFPNDITWKWVHLDNQDFKKIKYPKCEPWFELSDCTGLLLIAAKKILPNSEKHDKYKKAVLDLKNGGNFSEAPILITDGNNTIILEGCNRLTCYMLAMASGSQFNNIRVLLGYCSSKDLKKWAFYQ